TDTPLRFPGQYADEETGWHYNFLRHYDPATARYATPDPLGLTPAPHHYGYVHNPHTWSDPLGLAAHPPTRLSDPHRIPGSIVREYDNIRMGRGTPRIDPNTGRQTIHRADDVPDRQRPQWRDSLEWDVPGTNHRILERPDGRLGFVLNHDYSSPFLFPAPWFPDGGVLPNRLR
ncbi:RHS repeat-associated core domain-containing protein, partial [Streptomyces hainanensis]